MTTRPSEVCAVPRTPLELTLHRAFGDVFGSGENTMPYCESCHGYHEEHIKVLQTVAGWNCQRAQKYHREVLARCLEQTATDRHSYNMQRRRFLRLAPYFRTLNESDPRYLQRMVALKNSRPDWDALLSSDGEKDLKRHDGLRLPRHLQEKADEIKKRFPISKRKSSSGRRRKLASEQRPLSVRTSPTRRKVRQSAAGRQRRTLGGNGEQCESLARENPGGAKKGH